MDPGYDKCNFTYVLTGVIAPVAQYVRLDMTPVTDDLSPSSPSEYKDLEIDGQLLYYMAAILRSGDV